MHQCWLHQVEKSTTCPKVLPSNPRICELPHFRIKAKNNNKGKRKEENGIPKVFGLIYPFAHVAMYGTKFILQETANFAARLLHHKERANSYPENLLNFTNPLASNIEAGNDKFTFKETTSKSTSLDLVEAMRKEIGAQKINKHWTLLRRR